MQMVDVVNFSTQYDYVIMGAMASQITSLTIVFSTVYSGADQRKHQSSTSLAFVRGFHRSSWSWYWSSCPLQLPLITRHQLSNYSQAMLMLWLKFCIFLQRKFLFRDTWFLRYFNIVIFSVLSKAEAVNNWNDIQILWSILSYFIYFWINSLGQSFSMVTSLRWRKPGRYGKNPPACGHSTWKKHATCAWFLRYVVVQRKCQSK